MNNTQNIAEEIKKVLSTFRIDIKNTGSSQNDIVVSGEKISVFAPDWAKNTQGNGRTVQGRDSTSTIKIKAVLDGVLSFSFRGMDKRVDEQRVPLWIDYTSIKIDGKEILSTPIAVWHDKPFHYEIPVKNEQEISLEISWQYHPYLKEELENIVTLLYHPQPSSLASVVQAVSKETQAVYTLKTKKLQKLPSVTANYFIPLGEACRPAH